MRADEYREFPCDLCGTTDAVELPYSREYTNNEPVYICRTCGFVYVRRRRSAQRIAEVWSEEIFEGGYTARMAAMRARLTFVAEFVEAGVGLRDKLVRDVGAGEGEFLDLVRQGRYGARVVGIEPSPKNCRLLKEMGIEAFRGTIEEFCASSAAVPGGADIVTILWTLENCQSCRAMLNGAHRILKPGGHVVVATGSRILVPFKKPLHVYFSQHAVDTHAFRFSANTLRGLLAVSGFETTHVNRYVDNDILCVIAKKVDGGTPIPWVGDDYLEVYNYFERWHVETKMYYPPLATEAP